MSTGAGRRLVYAGFGTLGLGAGAIAATHWKEGPPASGDAAALRALPTSLIGIAAHYVGSIPVPRPLRQPIYTAYCSSVSCDPSEFSTDLSEYVSFAHLFQRSLRPSARPIDESVDLVVPCDGTVVAAGQVGAYGSIKVKNVEYRIRDLVGGSEREPLAVSSVAVAEREESGSRLWYSVIHIGPGQCHWFYSPATWELAERRHIEGYLLWMNPDITGLYSQNERLVMLGSWAQGLFTMTAVGAAGRGSVRMQITPETFRPQLRPSLNKMTKLLYDEPHKLKPGLPLGGFQLGSAVVLVFEAPESFKFEVESGDDVRLGQKMGTIQKVVRDKSPTVASTQKAPVGGKPTSARAKFRRAW